LDASCSSRTFVFADCEPKDNDELFTTYPQPRLDFAASIPRGGALDRTLLDNPAPAVKDSAPVKQSIVTLDMEGVLTPEIWIAVAESTRIPELRRTTRDEPDYDKLMRGRLKILDQHGLKLSDIQQVIGGLKLLEGAKAFLDELRSVVQVIILSDTFEQFAAPLLHQMGRPTLLCHRLVVNNDRIVDYKLRIPEQKQRAVAALKLLNYQVIAAGDSFNDTAMLSEAHIGFLFHAPEKVKQQFPRFKAVEEYSELLALIKRELS
jgi:phosphoserine/homoserine phosphotransferase